MDKLIMSILDANRHLRHDFLNYLQVIWGYIQLDKKEEAVNYIQEISEYLASLKELNNIDDHILAGEISSFVLKIGRNRQFQFSVPERWVVKTDLRLFLQNLFKNLFEDINDEKIKIKITLLENSILLEGQFLEVGYTIDWANLIASWPKEFIVVQEFEDQYFRILIKNL